MFNYGYILTLGILLSILLSGREETLLLINSINDNKIELSFEFNPKKNTETNSLGSINMMGMPQYNYILSMPNNNIDFELSYNIKSKKSIKSSKDAQHFFVDGISKNETYSYDSRQVFIADEFIKNNNRYIILSICPIQGDNSDNIISNQISITLDFEQSISNNGVKILDTEETVNIVSRNNQEDALVLLIIAPDGENIHNLIMPLINWKKQKGYRVFYHTLSEVGYTNNEIKSFIQRH